MIVSYKHQFVFMHCRKTAGSSMQVALSPHLGWRDVQIGAWKESIGAGSSPTLRIWADVVASGRPLALARHLTRGYAKDPAFINGAVKSRYRERLGRSPEHASAEAVSRHFATPWSKFYKFCFVRNPYEKAVSDWKWRQHVAKQPIAFSEWIRIQLDASPSPLKPDQPDNWPIYTINDAVAVDFVGRYETIENDWRAAMKKIGIANASSLPFAKMLGARNDYHDFYGPGDSSLVARLFEKEIETFGYKF